MNIMNLIHDICLTKNSINNTPNWRFISKNKYKKKLNNNILEFLNLDIFSASDNMISFLVSLGSEITCNINGYLRYCEIYITIQIPESNITTITYYPTSNRFEVENDYIRYTIYRNNKISNNINNVWEPLTHKIKKRYIDIIIQMADYLTLKQQEVK